MKKRLIYFICFVLIIIISSVIRSIFTNSKYLYNITMESDIDLGVLIFNIKPVDETITAYDLPIGEEITANYKLSNTDEDNNINQMELRYFLKIVDDKDSETLPLDITIDGYKYLKYNIDKDGNIIDATGNIIDENGEIIKKQNLTEEENEELQKELTLIKKGFGPIPLSHDGKTVDEKDIDIIIKCPEDYLDNPVLNYKIKVIAEGIVDTDFTAEETLDLVINVKEPEEISNELENTTEIPDKNLLQDPSLLQNNSQTNSENSDGGKSQTNNSSETDNTQTDNTNSETGNSQANNTNSETGISQANNTNSETGNTQTDNTNSETDNIQADNTNSEADNTQSDNTNSETGNTGADNTNSETENTNNTEGI